MQKSLSRHHVYMIHSNCPVLVLCEGNPPVTGGSPHKVPVLQKSLPCDVVLMIHSRCPLFIAMYWSQGIALQHAIDPIPLKKILDMKVIRTTASLSVRHSRQSVWQQIIMIINHDITSNRWQHLGSVWLKYLIFLWNFVDCPTVASELRGWVGFNVISKDGTHSHAQQFSQYNEPVTAIVKDKSMTFQAILSGLSSCICLISVG